MLNTTRISQRKSTNQNDSDQDTQNGPEVDVSDKVIVDGRCRIMDAKKVVETSYNTKRGMCRAARIWVA